MNKILLILVMLIWGSLGVFTRSIPISAVSLAFLRALIALPVLFVTMKIKKRDKIRFVWIIPYVCSGILLGLGWLTLFYGFKHTSISSAVIIYNMCPIYVMLLAPLILKEAITKVQIGVIAFSFLGLVFIIGNNSVDGYGAMGLFFSALSGMMYAAIVIINRSIKNRLDNQLATFIQILSATMVLLPFAIVDGDIFILGKLERVSIIYIILLGILHTGVAYTMFFSVYQHMKSIEIVSYSFLEPLFGILFSVIFIGEKLSVMQIIGGILILGSAYMGEIFKDKKVFQ